MIEFEVDMSEVADELDTVILHDECGEHESVEYVRKTEHDKALHMIRILRDAGDFSSFLHVDELDKGIRELGIEVAE